MAPRAHEDAVGAARHGVNPRQVLAAVALADCLVLVVAVVAALQVKFGWGTWRPDGIEWFTGLPVIDFGWLVPVWLVGLGASDSYSRRQFARGTDEFRSVLKGTAWAAALVTMVAYLVNYDMSRGFFVLAFALGTLGLLLERTVARRVVLRLRDRGHLMHRVVAVGGAPAIAELRAALQRESDLGYELVGACVPVGGPEPTGVPVLGGVEDSVAVCRSIGADTLIVVGGTFSSSEDLRRIGWELENEPIDLIVMPSLLDVAGPRMSMRPVAGLPFVHVEPPQVARAMRWGKALFDRLGAAALLVLLAPLLLAVTVAVRSDGGPALFRHRRIGVDGLAFDVLKFRSMGDSAAAAHQSLVSAQGAAILLFKMKDDPRVTPVGRLIRKYSLDELPQLFNVLRGEMSLVGPRPQVAEEVAAYDPSAHRRLLVRPGMTGLWQVSGRSNLSYEESVRLDLSYVDNWSMAGDLVILAKTVRAVLRHDGAY